MNRGALIGAPKISREIYGWRKTFCMTYVLFTPCIPVSTSSLSSMARDGGFTCLEVSKVACRSSPDIENGDTANLRTNIMDFRGFDSSIILI